MKLENEISINDLAKYSSWPKIIMGSDEISKKHKTPKEITREYNIDKWGALLEKMNNSNCSLKDLIRLSYDASVDIPILFNDKIILQNSSVAFHYYLNLIAETILKYSPITTIVDLGAGTGSIVLSLASHDFFKNVDFYAGEYTQNGCELIKTVAAKENIHIQVDMCDLSKKNIINMNIPKNAIIFTSYTIPYIPKLHDEFIDAMLKLQPSLVINFEPCYEYYNSNTLLGLMQRRYIEVNDYNTNFIGVLSKANIDGKIKIVEVKKNIFGTNPFLPMSIVAWKPQ